MICLQRQNQFVVASDERCVDGKAASVAEACLVIPGGSGSSFKELDGGTPLFMNHEHSLMLSWRNKVQAL